MNDKPDRIEIEIGKILKRENGYVNNPADRGGPTKYGITINALQVWRGHFCDAADIEALTEQEACSIYRHRYVQDSGIAPILDQRVFGFALDMVVLHGAGRAARLLQEAVGVEIDGWIGPKTIGRINRLPPDNVIIAATALRLRFIGEIINRDHSQAIFAAGWINRMTSFLLGEE